jgi:hypothetical protein
MRAASQYSVEALYDELWVWAQASLGYVGFGCKSRPGIELLPLPARRDRPVVTYLVMLDDGGRLRSGPKLPKTAE